MDNQTVDLSAYQNTFTFRNKLYRAIWNISYVFLFRPFGLPVFRSWRIYVLNLFGSKIHKSAQVYASVRIWAPFNLEMGQFSCLGRYVDCYNQGKITIGDHSIVSQKSYLCASGHDITCSNHPLITSPIIIQNQTWIAADVFIGPGVTIGTGAVVGARASVFKDVEQWTVVGGNPAKFLKLRELKN